MHLAFVTAHDPADIRSFSGVPYYVTHALRQRVDRLSVVGPLAQGGAVRGRLAKLRYRLGGQTYLRAHTWASVRGLAADAAPQIAALRPDAVVTMSTLPLAALDADCPTACWPDATFEANLLFYPDFTGLPDAHVIEAHAVERAAIERSTVAAFATAHGADSARGYYGVDDGSVHVVEYGANLEPGDVPPAEAIADAVAARSRDVCRLLFVGGGWVRKGGDVALRVAEVMTARGVPTTLTVAGSHPPVDAHPLLRATGFLRKDVPAERDRLRALFAESHFLCMPVRAEDFGCVFAEAAAFGLPSLTTDIGGMPTTVGDDAGVLFRFQERPQVIADRALELWSDRAAYGRLATTARAKYDRVLNWDAGAERLLALLAPHVR
ncbi:glycosyltransferase family 4 protein [Rubrivirga sp. IMCC45206]|uniref:glycosyltransferase family 4 protein n=1 Tax=Rubrivirga sp. IMCC45206 TaxID=3391614 RepID=UPI00398FD72B